MSSHEQLLDYLKRAAAAQQLTRWYGNERQTPGRQAARYGTLVAGHRKQFGEGKDKVRLFSAPGRVEVGGNHTDHNHGRVLAAAVNLDVIAAVTPATDYVITVHSEGYGDPFRIDLSDLDAKEDEKETSSALIRGICRAFRDRGYKIGGFNACVTSDVAVGSGLSSSAAFEVLIATTLNHLFNGGDIPAKDIALMGQYAENYYFGKPSGLMDQMTGAVGGLVTIDFQDPTNPLVRKLDFDFASCGYDLVVVNTGGSHADLTPHYSAVATEMKAVATALGKNVLREVSFKELTDSIKKVRREVGDRAVLRALHFFADNERVAQQVNALAARDVETFLRLVNESGQSSWMLLQNLYAPERPAEQGLALALAVTDQMLKGKGACRVHGGGFAGTILVFVPHELTASYTDRMNDLFGDRAAQTLRVRSLGAGEVFPGC
ncbi:MAG: galactokinase family protein [bacterium]|nr:galactokinase family protein [bacterium]